MSSTRTPGYVSWNAPMITVVRSSVSVVAQTTLPSPCAASWRVSSRPISIAVGMAVGASVAAGTGVGTGVAVGSLPHAVTSPTVIIATNPNATGRMPLRLCLSLRIM